MSEGRIVEQGKTETVMKCPQSDVTKALIAVATDVKKFWGITK
jgi:ABC-type microcin C transport system duplicated ATPase subunit YejF